MFTKSGILILLFSLLISPTTAEKPETTEGNGDISEYSETSPLRVYFRDLRKYPLFRGEVPDEVNALDGKEIQIVGYMIPFDRIENITQFILLQAPFMGCLHVPPPQANETIMVTTERPLRSYTYDPLRITGTLIIDEVHIDGYLVSVYTIQATRIESSTATDAELDDLPPGFHFYGDL